MEKILVQNLVELEVPKHLKEYISCENNGESRCLKQFSEICDKGKNIIDVGGFCGMYTVLANKMKNCKTYTFEPRKEMAYIIKHNLKNSKNYKIFNLGVSNKNKKAYFHFPKKTNFGNTREVTNETENLIKLVRLDDFLLSNLDIVDILKIDVEGFEYEVLLSCGRYIKNIKNIFIELHLYNKYISAQWANIILLLKQNNFIIKYLDNSLKGYEDLEKLDVYKQPRLWAYQNE